MSETFTAFEGQRRLASGSARRGRARDPRCRAAGIGTHHGFQRYHRPDHRPGSPRQHRRHIGAPALDDEPSGGTRGIKRTARSRTAEARRGRARGHPAPAPLGMAQRPARRCLGGTAQARRRRPPHQRRPGSPARGTRCRLSLHVGNGRQPSAFRGGLAGLVRRRSAPIHRTDRELGPPTFATMP